MRIIVKIGSNVITRADGRLSLARMAALADEVTALHEQGHQVVLVTSGAVAAGKAQVSLPKTVDPVARRQVLSSVGQTVLIDTYRTLFAANGLNIGQILVTKNDFSSAEHATNMRQCLHALFAYGILPVVNENDTVSVESLMFTDNDELAGLLATLLDADQLIILSSVDGLYTGDPSSPNAKLIREVAPGEDWTHCVAGVKTSSGRGGMGTKLAVAGRVAAAGGRREWVGHHLGCRDRESLRDQRAEHRAAGGRLRHRHRT
jgi:glutamate 5-kinase